MIAFSKFLTPTNYLDKFHRIWDSLFAHDMRQIEESERLKFLELGLDVKSALDVLNPILQSKYGRDFDFGNDSIHWLVFSALSTRKYPARRILEIGTYDGECASILSSLFPDAEIFTIDLPENDPLLRDLYNRQSDSEFLRYKRRQEQNLNKGNIRLIETNSFFLLDKVDEEFDLVWVDGGHLYPEVAWDLCSAFHLCRSGGYLMCDDVIPLTSSYKNEYVSTESFKVIEYIQARIPGEVTFFLKRRAPNLYTRRRNRKYVACMKKP